MFDKGDILRKIKCYSVGSKGDGIFKQNKGDLVIIVKNAELKKIYDIEITEVKKTVAFAKIIEEY